MAAPERRDESEDIRNDGTNGKDKRPGRSRSARFADWLTISQRLALAEGRLTVEQTRHLLVPPLA